MKMKKGCVALLCLCMALTGWAQNKPDTLIKKLDSLSKKTDTAGGQKNVTTPAAYNEATQLNAPTYFILLGSDIKQAFTKPFHMKKRDWGYLGGFVAATAAL